MSSLREECGVFGVYSGETSDVASTAYYGLFALQHRGQESCGIVVNDDGVFKDYKDTGLVNDVFTPEIIERLGEGNIAVGHARYGTTGSNDRSNAQPIVVNHIKGKMALAHNGNLINSGELRRELELEGSIFHTTSDTEVIAYIITKERLTAPSIEQAVNAAMNRIKGAYSLVIMSPSKLIAVRDENGFRPLCYGKTEDGRYIVASESCALDAVGAEFIRDIKPGEIVVFDKNGVRTIEDHCKKAPCSLCVFEYIYFARPDSVIDGCPVHTARQRAGAKEIHMRVSAPPFMNPCYYGTDIDSRENLIACKHSVDEIAKLIGVDSLGYLSVESVKQIAKGVHGTGYCTACFDGNYPTEIPSAPMKNRFETKISENKENGNE